MGFIKKGKIGDYTQECKTRFLKEYGQYIDRFAEKNVELVFKIKKASYFKGLVDLVAEIELIPKTEFKCGELYWKKFSVKFYTLKKQKNAFFTLFVHKRSFLFNSFLNRTLCLLNKVSPHTACKETFLNYCLRVVCFSRFSKFPIKFKGKDLTMAFIAIYALVLAIIIASIKDWQPWY